MTQKKIDRIILKFLEDRISEEESNELKNWLKDSENKAYFEKFIEVNYFLQTKKKFHSQESLDKTMAKIITVKRIPITSYFKYAAMILLFLGLGYSYQQGYFSPKPVFVNPSESITLELENGALEIINEEGSSKVVDAEGNIIGTQEGSQIVYTNAVEKEDLVYNTIRVPNGKRFQLVLSDGTNVHINAGTTLRYPVKFIKNKERLVFVDGEAYFNVAKDKTHPFIVNANEMNIRVTGTQFNVSNYPEDDAVNAVLVEGSVSVYGKEKEFNNENVLKMIPGELASFNRATQKTKITQVDTSLFTGWIYGVLVFKHMKFSDILVKLERKYDVNIQNYNTSLSNETFTARFESVSIEHVLETLNKSYGIEYTFAEKNIIIN